MKFKFNIPNKITIIRVSLIPLFAIILLVNIPYKNLFSAFIFVMLSISDFLDGYFARKKKQVTEFGKLIDPIADKLLIATALIFLIGKGIDLWMAIVIISREVVITAMRIYLIPKKIIVPASNFGKAKTIVQSLAIVFVLLKLPLNWYVMLTAVVLTVVSGIDYVIKIKGLTGNKIVNLPNMLTLVRFLLVIPFVYYFLSLRINITLLIFAIIALSDKLDGVSARLMNQKTELGGTLDSFTDGVVIVVSFSLFVIKDYLSLIWIFLLILPAIIIPILKIIIFKKQREISVTPIAKVQVGITYVAIIAVLVNFVYKEQLLIVALILMYLSMFRYLFLSKGLLYARKS
ncbi:CDP-diacylglycerol--glycerol-3-phosphate 3-phosphatidyltransferase [Candidatus Woesearchaeota archaeon]|nr:CDP-diacylglycerol--glycerol-3-phosphate 3-phosphatidyltransferase [Candidatus Woesearchaeota archaeon]